MASTTIESAAMLNVLQSATKELPWREIKTVVQTMGNFKHDVSVPGYVDVTKTIWAWAITMEAARHGLMALRDGYGDSLTFVPLPSAVDALAERYGLD